MTSSEGSRKAERTGGSKGSSDKQAPMPPFPDLTDELGTPSGASPRDAAGEAGACEPAAKSRPETDKGPLLRTGRNRHGLTGPEKRNLTRTVREALDASSYEECHRSLLREGWCLIVRGFSPVVVQDRLRVRLERLGLRELLWCRLGEWMDPQARQIWSRTASHRIWRGLTGMKLGADERRELTGIARRLGPAELKTRMLDVCEELTELPEPERFSAFLGYVNALQDEGRPGGLDGSPVGEGWRRFSRGYEC